jgi:hypothetical protein
MTAIADRNFMRMRGPYSRVNRDKYRRIVGWI